MSSSRVLKYLGALVLVLAALYGAGRLWLGRPAAHDRYTVLSDDTIEFVPARCRLTEIGLGCRPRFLRLYGIDLFEPAQTCGDAAGRPWPCGAATAARLKALVAARDFACRIDHGYADSDGRRVAFCYSGGADVGATLVREGLAFEYGRGLQYLPLEAEARAARRGAWVGHFVRPQFWRQGARD